MFIHMFTNVKYKTSSFYIGGINNVRKGIKIKEAKKKRERKAF